MSVIILGDVHIGRSISLGRVGLGSYLNSRVSDQIDLLDWTLDQAIELNANNIIITGDIFEDPKPHPALITLFIGWLKKCEINGVHVHIVMGNHDILRTGNYYTSPLDIITYCELENVSIYKNIDTTIIDSVAFTFLPFRDRKSFFCDTHDAALEVLQQYLVYEISAIPMIYKKVLVGHLALEGSIPVGDEIDDMSNELMCPVEMFKGYDYVWMGHVHKPQVMSKSPYIAHIGSMDISNFGETDHKKHIIVFNSDEKEMFHQITIPTRPLKKIVISVPKDTKDTTKYVITEITKNNPELNKSIVRLEVHLTSPELLPINRATVEKFLYTTGVHNVCGISESKKLSPIKKTSSNVIDTTMDVAAALKKYATIQVDADKRDLFTELAIDIYKQYKSEAKD